MVERRKIQRHRVLKPGTISFNRGGGIDCTVRNLSPSGASLDVASLVGIPDEFILIIGGDHDQHPCRVIWRKEKRIGVIFG
jgi:PilZ domain